MKLIMTLLVRDEQDIIHENIEYHLAQGVDFFIATDNRSEDITTDILKEYEAKGLLHYIYEGSDDYNQHAWVTRMARMASTDFGANWVINNDADEFWWPVAGSLKETFENLPPRVNRVQAERNNFVMVEDTDVPFWSRMVYRERVSLNSTGNPLPPKMSHRGSSSVKISQGNHSVAGMEEDGQVETGVIEILHYPVRGYSQIENKIVKGGAAYERNDELPKHVGSTWRELYSQYKENSNLIAYYERQLYGDQRLKQSLANESIVLDERLSAFFKQL